MKMQMDPVYKAARRASGLARFERETRGYTIPGSREHGDWCMRRRVCNDYAEMMRAGTMDLRGNRIANTPEVE
jgi:hypothetical protein